MERREFLGRMASLVALSGGATLLADCATTKGAKGGAINMEELTTQLDQLQEKIRQSPVLEGISLPPCTTAQRKELSRREDLVREILAGALLVGVYRELPEKEREHPLMQARVERELPRLDQSLLQTATFLEGFSPVARGKLQEVIREDPQFARLQEKIFERASFHGVPRAQQEHLERLLGQTVWRLKHQNPSLIIGEYVGKLDRLLQREGISPAQRRRLAQGEGGPPSVRSRKRGKRIASQVLLGLGAGQAGLGGALLAISIATGNPFVATPGIILLTLGLVGLIVSLSLYLASK